MSEKPAEYPFSDLPLLPAEVVRSREEDPSFAEVLGRARARIAGVEYDPAKHYPHRPGAGKMDVPQELAEKVQALIADWAARADHPDQQP